MALGAFGAHIIRDRVTPADLGIWQTAVQYQMVHGLAMLLVAVLPERFPRPRVSLNLFGVGVLIFSGSLYLLVLTNTRWLGAITPLGGLCFLAGWLSIAWPGRKSG